MVSVGNISLFMVAAFVLLVTPGPAVFYIVARSAVQGSWAGIVSALGIVTGGFIHVLAGAAGLSALVLSSSVGFVIIKYLGALYLIYLGCRTLLGKNPKGGPNPDLVSRGLRRVYVDGLVVNLLNPKTILFFIAFLPQFVDPTNGNPGVQFLALGTVLVMMGLVTDSIYAALAGSAGRWLQKNVASRGSYYHWFAGLVYVSLGIFTLLIEPSRER